MKKTLLILNILLSWDVYSQQELLFPLKNEFSWESIEKPNSVLKAKLIKDFPKEFENYRLSDESILFDNRLDSCLHVMDFNYDGLDDVIFDGWSGGEARMISIFINNGKSFSKIFTDIQGIHKIVFENNRVSKLFIQDWGCCCEILITNKVYIVKYGSKIPRIELIAKMKFLNNSTLPSEYFEKPIKFSVLNDNYNIRVSPFIDDSTEYFYCGEPEKGNSVGKIQMSSIGYGLGQKIDNTNRIWWFVAMMPETNVKESLFYDSKDETKSYKVGWISSRYIKKINE